jgi:hypothetical protein
MKNDDVLMTLQVAIVRRFAGVLSAGLLGLLFIYLGFTFAGPFVAKIGLMLAGGGCFAISITMYGITRHDIELTQNEIRETSGKIVARLDDIASVDRGAFAFKPTNGFVIVLKERAPRIWRAGLWWRYGKRIGIGGITNVGQNKAMAEKLAALIEQRKEG